MKNILSFVNCCLVCSRCIIISDYDVTDEYYCNLDKTFPGYATVWEQEKWNKLTEWFKIYSVESNNICDNFKRIK